MYRDSGGWGLQPLTQKGRIACHGCEGLLARSL